MKPDRWATVERLYNLALTRSDDDRAAFLADACAGDDELQREVESLLAQQVSGAHVLSGAAAAVAAGLVSAVDRSMVAGRRIGGYHIVAPIGAGGMGEVYRARDDRLRRDVAIKILPRAFTGDPDRLARFEREARVLASLSHPHIGAIYGVEESDGMQALVLEYVEGDTLAERIARTGGNGLALKEALDLARQIADALDAAHEKGIVHRDLKPANIKITPQGVVKVLDFGLAKLNVLSGEPTATESPTLTIDDTREGQIIGTAAYMSPEQARGQAVDKRTDVWAFGCVFYEMLTGRAVFRAATVSDTIAAIIERKPDWSLLPASTPASVRKLLERSLRKDQKERLRDIGDARNELADTLATVAINAVSTRHAFRIALAVAVAVLLIGITGYFAMRRNATPPTDAVPVQGTFTQLTSSPGIEWFPSMSPDSKWVIYAGDSAGNRDIYLQSVTGTVPINLTKDSSADDDEPTFSPDGEQIAFRSSRDGGGIFVMGRTGEAVRRVTRAGFNPTWAPDGKQIAFTMEDIDVNPQNGRGPSNLFIVDVATGQQKGLNAPGAILADWSPHGDRIAYSIRSMTGNEEIWTTPVLGGTPKLVVTGTGAYWNPSWAADGRFLYFSSDRGGSMNLWRIAIDEASGSALGDPQPLSTPAPFAAHASVSADGSRLAYSAVLITTNIQRLGFDTVAGTIKEEDAGWVTTGTRVWASPDPSPDGASVTFYSRLVPEGDVYVARTDGTGLRQVTSDAALDRVPRWSPDGQWIAFFSNRRGPYNVWKIRPDGSDLQQVTEIGGGAYIAWSPDASSIATFRAPSGTIQPLSYIFDASRPSNEQKPQILPPFEPPNGQFVVNSWSPDGTTLAGGAGLDERGVVIYSIATHRYERLTDYGEWPVWLPDNRHLLFVSRGKDFYVVDTVTRQARKIYSSVRDVLGPPEISRDGRHIYFSRRVTESDIWTLSFK